MVPTTPSTWFDMSKWGSLTIFILFKCYEYGKLFIICEGNNDHGIAIVFKDLIKFLKKNMA